jgi:hypothetical protein
VFSSLRSENDMEDKKELKNIDQSSIAVKYFLDNFPIDVITGKVAPSNKTEELANIYLTRFTEVLAVFDRLIRYEKYFKDFFSTTESGISESEAIEYHLRSYIEEFYILQERVKKITNKLNEDIPYYKIRNEADVKNALKHLSNQIHSKLKKITSNLRREHVHERSISELDLVTGKFLNSLITGEMPIPDNAQINRDLIRNRYKEVLASSKKKHIQQSTNNSVSLKKMKGWFAARFIYIFSSLNGHIIEGLNFNIE